MAAMNSSGSTSRKGLPSSSESMWKPARAARVTGRVGSAARSTSQVSLQSVRAKTRSSSGDWSRASISSVHSGWMRRMSATRSRSSEISWSLESSESDGCARSSAICSAAFTTPRSKAGTTTASFEGKWR